MDQELVNLLKCADKESVVKGARMLASFLAKASFPSKAVLALREVPPALLVPLPPPAPPPPHDPVRLRPPQPRPPAAVITRLDSRATSCRVGSTWTLHAHEVQREKRVALPHSR